MNKISSHAVAEEIAAFLPSERIFHDEVRRRAFSVDASIFFRQAEVVVDVVSEEEVISLLAYANTSGVGVTFRGGGTSLNGQCSGVGILARPKGPFWKQIEVYNQGHKVKACCGALGTKMNEALAPFNKKIGPDPASLSTASFGGIIVNNAAGMCCTVEQNSYATLSDMRLILFDGTIVDTSDDENLARFRLSHSRLLDKLLQLRQNLLEDIELTERICRKYAIKNTCGYSVNAFIDFEDPVEILTHLMIGSEGTLGFVSNATVETIDTYALRATALIFFPDLGSAAQAVTRWSQSGAAKAAELFDWPTLRALANLPSAPGIVKDLKGDGCAVLIETQANNETSLAHNVSDLIEAIENIDTLGHPEFFTDEESCESLWAFRRAMFPAVAGARDPNQLVLLEDVCFPLNKIKEGCQEFGKLFKRYGYDGGVHGHAFHGNFHFALPVDFSSDQEKTKIHDFLEEMMQMVVSLDGSLKAEHGTGYAVAPFVELEWGSKIYDIMKGIKKLLDPQNIFNPGVLLNDDPKCHTKNLKTPTASHPKLDNCVECGFCEPVCPSKNIGFTPRQRVSVLRHITELKIEHPEKARQWEKIYDDLGTALCATDGICTTRCPLAVDVAGFVRNRRSQSATSFDRSIAHKIGCNFGTVTRGASLLLDGVARVQRLLGDAMMKRSSEAARKIVGKKVPSWNEHMPRGVRKLPVPAQKSTDVVVYMPSCAIRTMGDSVHDPAEPLADVTIRVLERAGYSVIFPEKMDELCCGKAFETKGLLEEALVKSREMEDALLKVSRNGEYPILCETSPCLARMKKVMDDRLKLYEPVEFACQYLLTRLALKKVHGRIAIHPTCSTRLLGLDEPLFRLAEQCAETVIWPREIQCCGFSGDKGFSHPELNRDVLESLAATIQGCEEGFSTSRTCEIGLSLHGKVPYKNVIYLLDTCTRNQG